jgi:drug/metabolite transporter (DMT)-like permease
MTGALLGLISALSWGAGDFLGGLASRTSRVYQVVIASQIWGGFGMLIIALIVGEEIPPWDDLVWAAGAAIFGNLGIVLLYRALASGNMGITAPVSAVTAAALPAAFGMLIEGYPGHLTLVGFVCALTGIWLVSRPDGVQVTGLSHLGLPLVAGAGFGIFFIMLDQASEEATFWPLLVARLSALVIMFTLATLSHQPIFPQVKHLPLICLAGTFDTGGNVFFALAAQSGRLDIASVMSSLYPGATVLLAFIVLREKITRIQWMGIGITLAAIVLIAL